MQWRSWRHAFRLVAVFSVLLAGQVPVQAQTTTYVTAEQAARASLSSLRRSSAAAAAAVDGSAAARPEISQEALELIYGRPAGQQEIESFAPASATAAAPNDLPERVHVFLFGHARDRTIGRGVVGGRGLVESLFAIAFSPVPEIEVLVYEVGFDRNSLFSQSNMLNTVRGANIGSNDVVFCYVMAHGGSTTDGLVTRQRPDNNGRMRTVPDTSSAVNHQRRYGHYWGMESPARQVMPRTVLAGELIKTRARLKVLISDSCNNSTTNPLAIPPAADAAFAATPSQQFFHLLTAFEGLVDINSSETGQYSWYSPAQPPTPASGIFTRVFCNAAANATELDWPTFFRNVQTETNRQAKTVRGTDPRDGQVKVGWRQFPMLLLPIDRVRPLNGAQQPANAPAPDPTIDGQSDTPLTDGQSEPQPTEERPQRERPEPTAPRFNPRSSEAPPKQPAEGTREATPQDAGPEAVPAAPEPANPESGARSR